MKTTLNRNMKAMVNIRGRGTCVLMAKGYQVLICTAVLLSGLGWVGAQERSEHPDDISQQLLSLIHI